VSFRTAGLVAALAALALAGGCARKDRGETQAGGVKLVEKGKLTVCTHVPSPPFQTKDASGKVVGFDIDLMELVAEDLGVEARFVDTPFEGIKSGQDLDTGKCDAGAASLTITDARKKVLDFSNPYFDATQAMLVKVGKSYESLDDLKGQKVGAMAGATGRDYTRQFEKEKGFTLVEFEDVAAAQQALANGQIEAAIYDLPAWTEYVKEHPGFAVAAEFDTGEQYGFVVKKNGNAALLEKINEVLARARQDGTYTAIYEKWIGKQPRV
jgi:polar amino acid transport system substrate-binding protein